MSTARTVASDTTKRNACVLRNMLVNMAALEGDQQLRSAMSAYVQSPHDITKNARSLASICSITSKFPLTHDALTKIGNYESAEEAARELPSMPNHASVRIAIVSDSSMIAHKNKKLGHNFVFDPAETMRDVLNKRCENAPNGIKCSAAKTFALGGGTALTMIAMVQAARQWLEEDRQHNITVMIVSWCGN